MCYNTRARGCSSMAERQLPKLNTRVRFPSPAPASAQSPLNYVSGNSLRLLPKTAFASLRLLSNPKHSASDLFFLLRAKSAQLRFRQQPTAIAENCAHYLAPPFKSEAPGFGFVFSFARKVRSTSFPATACGYCRKLHSLPCTSKKGSPVQTGEPFLYHPRRSAATLSVRMSLRPDRAPSSSNVCTRQHLQPNPEKQRSKQDVGKQRRLFRR